MTALFDGTSARGDEKWTPTIHGVPDDITRDIDSGDFRVNEDGGTQSTCLTNSQPTMPRDLVRDNVMDDMITNIGESVQRFLRSRQL